MSEWTITMSAKRARVKYRRVSGVVVVKLDTAAGRFVLEAVEHPKVLAKGDMKMEPQAMITESFPTLLEAVEAAKCWLLSYDAEAWLLAWEE